MRHGSVRRARRCGLRHHLLDRQRRKARLVDATVRFDLGNHIADMLGVDAVEFLDRAEQQQAADEDVELARYTFAIIIHQLETVGAEARVARPAHLAEAVEDIGFDFLGFHRIEMMRRDHALAQLFQRRRMKQRLAELGLAEQEYLQKRMAAKLEVRQHPQFFERRDREILPLVDDQQRAPPGARLFAQILLHRAQQFGLALPFPFDAELFGNKAQQIVALDLCRHQLDRGQPVRIDRVHQMADQRRLARADIAGDDDEAFALRQPIAKVGHRLAVRSALEIESGIGRQLERASGEAVELIVHRSNPVVLDQKL